ncbi:MAG: STAS/SEC14 domain-containing protein [Pirellulales bacterium]|nr:STAS/SEC14 domain-containing protein [Pirellulales bacterium]
MLDFTIDKTTGIVTATASGQLTEADVDKLTPAVDEVIAQQGSIRVLLQLVDFHGWEDRHAAWDHVTFVKHHHRNVERIAIVGDRKWEQWLATLARPFVHATQRYYDESQLDEARQWIHESIESPVGG